MSPAAVVVLLGVTCSAWPLAAQRNAPAPEAPEQNRAQAFRLNRDAAEAISTGDFGKAIGLLERGLKLLPGDPGLSFNLGLAYLSAGRHEDAVPPLRRAVTEAQYATKARFLLGMAYYGAGKFDLAVEQLKGLRQEPAYAANALYFLEESYRKTGRLAEAEEAYADLARRFPGSALVHKLLGTAFDAQSLYPEALREFETAARADPALPEVKFDAGLVALKLHDDEAAKKWFQAELTTNACYAAAHYYLGEIERKAGRWAEAATAYGNAIRCAPRYGDAHLGLGLALREQGHDAEALEQFKRAVEFSPEKSLAHFQLARALAKAGRAEESRAEWQKALQLSDSQEPKAGSGSRK